MVCSGLNCAKAGGKKVFHGDKLYQAEQVCQGAHSPIAICPSANQLSGFVPDFAHMTVQLRELTGKGKVFIWLTVHQRDFERVKSLLTLQPWSTELDLIFDSVDSYYIKLRHVVVSSKVNSVYAKHNGAKKQVLAIAHRSHSGVTY